MSSFGKLFETSEYRSVHSDDIERELTELVSDFMHCCTVENLRIRATSAQAVFQSLYMLGLITFDEHHFAFDYIHSAFQLRFSQITNEKT